MKKYFVIPFFILHQGCPHQCVFCDQNRITGQEQAEPEDISRRIDMYLDTMPEDGCHIEVGFFGGTFTGLDPDRQIELLSPVQDYIAAGRIEGVRVSTRPDFVESGNVDMLKDMNVRCIELGVQSASDRVLELSKRGHSHADTVRASRMILDKGFVLGHQMMLGLPGSSREDEYITAREAVRLGASRIRIYPTIVTRDTALARMWENGAYEPLPEEEAIVRSVDLVIYFEYNNVQVIRCGLHPAEGLLNGEDILAGPFHPAFRSKVESRIFAVMLGRITEPNAVGKDRAYEITINPADVGAFFGFRGENRTATDRITRRGRIPVRTDTSIGRGKIVIEDEKGRVFMDRRTLAPDILPGLLLKNGRMTGPGT